MSAASRSSTGGSHIAALDGVRGLAILMVMGVHFIGDQEPVTRFEHFLQRLGNYGIWGVDLFFVLSGFLITGILYDSKLKPRFFRNFYVRRTLRIFPIYYAVLAVLFLVVPLVPVLRTAALEESSRHQAWAWLYGTNIYLAIKDAWTLPYIGHFWSLAVEEHFYLVWPLVVFACSRATLLRVCVGAILSAIALRIGLALTGFGEVTQYVLSPCRLDALCAGSFLAVAARPAGIVTLVPASRPALYASGAVVLALSALHVATTSLDAVTLPLRTTVLAIFFGALLILSISVEPMSLLGRFFTSGTMRFLGKYSYGLYLFHGIIGYVLVERGTQEWITSIVGSHLLGMAAYAVGGAGVSLLVAILSYELFEKHFLRLKDRFAPSEQRPPARDPLPQGNTSETGT
jgi:peptidoglycan/LPS O-acetylase OafA/YrhL